MKKGIHPDYNQDTVIKCSCGSVLSTGGTQKEMHIEICSQCHPFYTGKKKVIDTTGRVDRFKKLNERAAVKKEGAQSKKEKRAKKAEKKSE